jgi:hypothetical protein
MNKSKLSRKTAGRSRGSAKKAGAMRTTKRRAKELEDSPRRRYQSLMADRHFGTSSDANLSSLRVAAISNAASLEPANENPTTPATPGASNWVPLGPKAIPNGQTYGGARVVVTGRVTAIVPHPSDPLTIYVGSARGGIWKTNDGGVTWTPKSDNAISLAIGSLAISRSSPQTLYAGTGEGNIYYYALNFPLDSVNASYDGSGILKSIDGGNNWTVQGAATFTGSCFYKIAVHPTDPNTVLAASNLGLYRTIDGGISWIQLTSGLPAINASVIAATDVVFDPVAPSTAYVGFWGSGIYKTTNARDPNPSWTKLSGGLPASDLSRIAVAISPTSHESVYALIANASDALNGFFVSSDSGATWTRVVAAAVQVFGAYTLGVAVDISTPDVVYLSGVSLYKAVRTAGVWSVTEIGANIHPDNHAFASHPTNHLVIYAGTDGGAYKSSDGGATWDDTFNEGICISQFEFIDQHPTSDSIIIGGTQDNGTEQFRNSPAFYHSADGDGGSAGIDHMTPHQVIHTYYGVSPERSTQSGNFGTYSSIGSGIVGASLFYPPLAYDQTNSQNVAFGTDRINLDAAQGTGGWPTKVSLPGISGRVSAIWYPNSNLIFACSTAGEVYRLSKSGGTWTANLISAAPLPTRWIWGVATKPGDLNTVVIGMAGFGTAHVWRGAIAASGTSATWSDVSGVAPHRLPDSPVNALCIDLVNPNTYFIGTDVGVFRSTDAGVNWLPFSDGLPNTAVYDLLLHGPTRLLRAATHGRGLWERKLDVASMPNVDIFVRDQLMDTGRVRPTPSPVVANFSDPLQQVSLGDQLWWWMCADIKIDSPSANTHTYQMPVSAVDYLAFETRLAHTNPQRATNNRVYVQIHNRGIQAAVNVTVKILYADATPGLPNFPADFWTAFPHNGDTTFWKPIGEAKVISSVSSTRPEIVEWDWVPPSNTAHHTCLLIVCDCASDPIPSAHKVFDVASLINFEKRVGLKNLHIIDPQAPLTKLHIGQVQGSDLIRLISPPGGWSVGVLLPTKINKAIKVVGLGAGRLSADQIAQLKKELGGDYKLYNPANFRSLDQGIREASISNIPETAGFDVMLNFTPSASATNAALTLLQERDGRVIGGNTFVLIPKESPNNGQARNATAGKKRNIS